MNCYKVLRVTAALMFLLILPACGFTNTPASFEDNLSIKLKRACQAFVDLGGASNRSNRWGYRLVDRYLSEHPDDARALYLRGYGAATMVDISSSAEDFKHALELGLPNKQAELAKMMLATYASFQPDAGPAVMEMYDKAQEFVRKDLEKICPTSTTPSLQTEATGELTEYFNYHDALSQLVTSDGIDTEILIDLRTFPYRNTEDVSAVTEEFLKAELKLQQQGQSLLVATLIELNIKILADFIDEQRSWNTDEALNGIEVLMDILLDTNSPIEIIQFSSPELRSRLQAALGEEKGEEVFQLVARTITEHLDTPQAKELWTRLTPTEQVLLSGEEEIEKTKVIFGECLAASPRNGFTNEGINAASCIDQIIEFIKNGKMTIDNAELAILLGREEFPPTDAQVEKEIFPFNNYFLSNQVDLLEDLANDPQWHDKVENVVSHLVSTIECQVLEDCVTDREADMIEARNASKALSMMLDRILLKEMVNQSKHRLKVIMEKLEESGGPPFGKQEELNLWEEINIMLERLEQ